MNRHQWLEELAGRLRDQGLPLGYIQRCLLELDGHLEETLNEGSHQEVETLLDSFGTTERLAAGFVASYRGANWYRRMPAFVWWISTLPLAVLCTIGFYAVIGILFGETERWFPAFAADETLQPIVYWCFFVGKIASPAIAAYLLLRILAGIGRPLWVNVTALSLLSLAYLFVVAELQIHTIADAELSIGITSSGLIDPSHMIWQLCQTLTVALIAIWDTVSTAKQARNTMFAGQNAGKSAKSRVT